MKTNLTTICSIATLVAIGATTEAQLSPAELEANARRLTLLEAEGLREQPEVKELHKSLTGKWQGETLKGGSLTVVFKDGKPHPTMQITEAGKPASPECPYVIMPLAGGKPRGKKIGRFSEDTGVAIHRVGQDNVPDLTWKIVSMEADSIQIVAEGSESQGFAATLKRVP